MHTNALIHEKSPYLRQHAHNPVDWLPWGERAFRKAQAEDKPIFLSIGYSTCHWCHVMAHESFENESIAVLLNEHFVPVKVDREERPDVDRIYMLFVQASTGSGGWPMSVWLTPDRKPFFGGTYFPPTSRYGRPGFSEVLTHLGRAWRQERAQVESSGSSVIEQLKSLGAATEAASPLNQALFEAPLRVWDRVFDDVWGGFGGAPKFPRPVVFNYLLRLHGAMKSEEALAMTIQTLEQMARGGMCDQLGGGFHRYSVDERWFVPHFEKMLYDQAQLAISYLEAFQLTADPAMAAVARGIFSYVLRDMRDTHGAFYSAEDADSPDPDKPGHSGEGAFYIWREDEIRQCLGPLDASLFAHRYGVRAEGNVEHDPQQEFEGRNILYQAMSVEEAASRVGMSVQDATDALSRAQEMLFKTRARRPRPHLDNKVLTSWNGLMISALAKGYAVLGDEEYRNAAVGALHFLEDRMYDPATGRLWRRYCEGEAAVEGFLDDYAFLAQALLDMFEVTFDESYLAWAENLIQQVLAKFDAADGGFYSTEANASDLPLRLKDDHDGAEPSGNSVATDVLLRLARLKGDELLERKASRSLEDSSGKLRTQPSAAPQMLVALGRWLSSPSQVVLRCERVDDQVESYWRTYMRKFQPNTPVLIITDGTADKFSRWNSLKAIGPRQGWLTVYRCDNYVCELPLVVSEADRTIRPL